MSDDFSLFDRRMRRPAMISLGIGLVLGVFAVYAQRITSDAEVSLFLALPMGLGAALALYIVSYRNLKKRHS